MIKLKNICKKYDDNTVLDNFSLSLASRDRIALMGGSGCGKTTLLHIATGLLKADSGEVVLDGKFSLMFQEPRLLPWATITDNICTVLSKPGSTLAAKYLIAVGLSDAGDKLPHELSGGMAQRASFARFLAYAEATDADILMLDEPFSALDGETEKQMLSLLKSFAVNKTLIIVTHDESHAAYLDAKIIKI